MIDFVTCDAREGCDATHQGLKDAVSHGWMFFFDSPKMFCLRHREEGFRYGMRRR